MNNKKTTRPFASLVCVHKEEGFELFEGELFFHEKPPIGSPKDFVNLGANVVCKNEFHYESTETPVVIEVLKSVGDISFRLITNGFIKIEESRWVEYLKQLAPAYLVELSMASTVAEQQLVLAENEA